MTLLKVNTMHSSFLSLGQKEGKKKEPITRPG